MFLRFFLVFLFTVPPLILSAQTEKNLISKGADLYFNEQYQEAYELLLPYADKGNADAEYYIGAIYFWGKSIKKDQKTGWAYLEKSAQQGNMYAEFSLGIAYAFGDYVSEDMDKALKWLCRAKAQGHPDVLETFANISLDNPRKGELSCPEK